MYYLYLLNIFWYMMNFQDSCSYIMMLMIYFHDFILMILLIILFLILYIMFWFFNNLFIVRNILSNHLIEMIWTLIPMFILMFMILPSLKILYMFEDLNNNFFLTIKILGHQWYWSYEYSDFNDINFDSFMVNDLFLKSNFRLLDVDNRFILPFNFMIRLMISSVDVIHSWTIPSLGIKIDSMPGRINQCMFMLNRLGIFFGQCSEICGLNHSFMPIVLESINLFFFLNWLNLFIF